VGESGCGKTVAALSILRLIPAPGRIVGGSITWNNRDILSLSARELRSMRGREIAMIFQNPQMALNPLFTIGDQITTVLQLHQDLDKKTAQEKAKTLFETVRIPDAEKRFYHYPSQLSGGLCQRVMIAMALACRPHLLIADEPTAALDVTVQAQILDLLLEIRDRFRMAILLISHDMGVVARMCDRVSVMYLGKIVERAGADELFAQPKHPYTEALLKAVLIPDPGATYSPPIQGDLFSTDSLPQGCRFHPRCPKVMDRCHTNAPLMMTLKGQSREVACWLYTHETNP
jgi:oligopeptide/dipeptide ABC transporter ATP-binding protein